MITAKQLNGTYPHRQMRMYIEDKYPDANAHTRGAHLAALVKKFLFNFQNNPHGVAGWVQAGLNAVPEDIDQAFTWDDTPEGHDFWRHIDEFTPERFDPARGLIRRGKVKPPAPKAPPKKQIGWWV